MEQIAFKQWRLVASIVDTDVLKLDIQTLDGSDIIEIGYAGQGTGKDGEQYALRFTTQDIEDSQARARRENPEPENDEAGPEWLSDEDETLYIRGWEVNALVDEDGLLNVYVEKGDNSDIYEVEPIESGVPLSSRVIIRLASEETEDEDEEDTADDLEEDLDEFDEFDEEDSDDLEDLYDDEEGYDDFDDLYSEEDRY